jgi:hypothetical protein
MLCGQIAAKTPSIALAALFCFEQWQVRTFGVRCVVGFPTTAIGAAIYFQTQRFSCRTRTGTAVANSFAKGADVGLV